MYAFLVICISTKVAVWAVTEWSAGEMQGSNSGGGSLGCGFSGDCDKCNEVEYQNSLLILLVLIQIEIEEMSD